MLHRIKKQNDMHQGKWNGLGGKLIPGESPEECASREILEESGLVVEQMRLCGVITFPSFDEIDDWYCFLYVVDAFSGELIDSDEGILQWIPNDQLYDLNLWDGDKVFMRWLDRSEFFSAKFEYTNGHMYRYTVNFYAPGGTGSTQQVWEKEGHR